MFKIFLKITILLALNILIFAMIALRICLRINCVQIRNNNGIILGESNHCQQNHCHLQSSLYLQDSDCFNQNDPNDRWKFKDLASRKPKIGANSDENIVIDSFIKDCNQCQSHRSSLANNIDEKNERRKKRILVTGGAGFIGSHLIDRLLSNQDNAVIVADNFQTGHKSNIEHWIGHPNFLLLKHDIVKPLYVEVDEIYHLASPASPPHYMANAIKTIKTNSLGTINMLGLAKRLGARILIASTSEIYGDPDVHPQSESYWGNVNPIGPRSCYDEGKRVAESLTYAYAKQQKVSVRVARIFNTYGPRMHINDGRVVSNFIIQALRNQALTIYGDGRQTRSFQYVEDLIDGLIQLMNSNFSQPVNLGNPEEYSIHSLAKLIYGLVKNEPIDNEIGFLSTTKDPNDTSKILISERFNFLPPIEDDPQRRRPNITLAHTVLNWFPNISLRQGLAKTIDYFRKELEKKTFSYHLQ
ncbi:KDEL motif-containing protein 1-like [Sarcoptes scabiei]|nr:KDEL motif-containing protein 1-like [Sarcoptes scabiei]